MSSFTSKVENLTMPSSLVEKKRVGVATPLPMENIHCRIASALNVAPEFVRIEGRRTRYMSLFLQCWGLAAGTRFFAKIFLVDRYPMPARFATPCEELAAPENPDRPVEEQIAVERTRFQQMRCLMGRQNIPALLGHSIPDRVLVYEEVNGSQMDSLLNKHVVNWCRPNSRNVSSARRAMADAGAWLRRLHDCSSRGFEDMESGEIVDGLRALIRKRQMQSSPYARLALQLLEGVHPDLLPEPYCGFQWRSITAISRCPT